MSCYPLALEDYRDGAVVDEGHVHHRPEAARRDLVYACRAEPLAEVVEEACCLLGWGRIDEAGTPAFARVCEEGELGDSQGCSPGVFDAAVHLAFFVGHDPQSRYLLGQPVGFGFSVPVGDTDQQKEARADAGDPLSPDRNGGFLDALEDYAQGF